MNTQLVSWLQMVWEALSESDPMVRNAMLREASTYLNLLDPVTTQSGQCDPA
jgi:hypothetical protein